MKPEQIEQFVRSNSGSSIEFGTAEQAPSSECIAEAESALGCAFPSSYLWFLENYGGGEIHGEEIYSIYQIPSDKVVGGDVVARTLSNRKTGILKAGEIVLCTTDQGEFFVLDTQAGQVDCEYPVLRVTGKTREKFADSFSEFIVNFVGDAAL